MLRAAILLMAAPLFAAPSAPIGLIVMDCYTTSAPFEVAVDGRSLALIPADKRDDSIGLCYAENLPAATSGVTIRLRRAGVERVFDLTFTPRTKQVVISAASLHALASDEIFGLD